MIRERLQFVSSGWFLVTYFWQNRRRLLPIVVMLTLSVFGITITGVMTGSIQKSLLQRTDSFRTVLFLLPNWRQGVRTVPLDLAEQVRADQRVVRAEPGYILETYMPTLTGVVPVLLIGAADDFQLDLMAHGGLRLGEGRLPAAGRAEVALHASILKARGLKVGDALDPATDSREPVSERFTIVGKIEGGATIGILSDTYLQGSQVTPPSRRALLILPNRAQQSALEQDLAQLPREQVIAYTYARELARYQAEVGNMDGIVWLINVVIIGVISLSVGLLNMIFFMQRRNEIGLLAAMGYSRGFLIRRSLAESLTPTTLSWVLGVAFSMLIYSLLNRFLFADGSVSLAPVDLRVIGFTLPIPLAVGLFSAASVIAALRRLDPVQIIERRD